MTRKHNACFVGCHELVVLGWRYCPLKPIQFLLLRTFAHLASDILLEFCQPFGLAQGLQKCGSTTHSIRERNCSVRPRCPCPTHNFFLWSTCLRALDTFLRALDGKLKVPITRSPYRSKPKTYQTGGSIPQLRQKKSWMQDTCQIISIAPGAQKAHLKSITIHMTVSNNSTRGMKCLMNPNQKHSTSQRNWKNRKDLNKVLNRPVSLLLLLHHQQKGTSFLFFQRSQTNFRAIIEYGWRLTK